MYIYINFPPFLTYQKANSGRLSRDEGRTAALLNHSGLKVLCAPK